LDRFVSKQIHDKGSWSDCHVLTDLILHRGGGAAAAEGGQGAPLVYVDIAVGSCVMQVLLTTDARVLAFEPSAQNLFRLR
jgi:hypothetical protein